MDTPQYHYSGEELIGKIRPGERVLHIGYDNHLFEHKIPNYVSTLELEAFAADHSAQKFNVAFCLEYINFGDQKTIERQIDILVKRLREKDSRIYWRCNPGVQDYVGEQDIYAWTFDEHFRLAQMFGFEVFDITWDERQRIYAEWVRLNKSEPTGT